MEEIILQILDELRAGHEVDDRALLKLSHAAARRAAADKRAFAKRKLLPFYQSVKRDDPSRWKSWNVTPELEKRLLKVLRMKPRRSASGVATITVITKPWPCGGDCLFCPNDIRMPKSYLHNEPACERAEQNWFDPYLQVASRLNVLSQMGHATDKIELIVLGGTWSDYPESYQIWFMTELFRALNDGVVRNAAVFAGGKSHEDQLPGDSAAMRRERYQCGGFPQNGDEFAVFASAEQMRLNAGERTYNQAFRELYGQNGPWRSAARWQNATWQDLEREQHANERAHHRVVGLVVETRPDAITPAALTMIRRLGCTKVQMGIQSLDQEILNANDRGIEVRRIEEAFEFLRVFGFKIHAHAMANLYGATPERDKRDYLRLVSEAPFQPDEIKLYPCALIDGARLCTRFAEGSWRPYTEDELLDILVSDVAATPAWTRISRMIRDFSSHDIVAGNKKPNLRQLVEARLRGQGESERDRGDGIQEIRFREVGTGEFDPKELRLEVVPYETSNTSERFLQWVTPENRIAGFLRLSLPSEEYVRAMSGGGEGVGAVGAAPAGVARAVGAPAAGAALASAARADHVSAARGADAVHACSAEDIGAGATSATDAAPDRCALPVAPGEAMIREVHVYGMATQLGAEGTAAQHLGLGRKLVERACGIAHAEGYERINVISAVGTREYYRSLGFADHGLYQQKEL